MGGGRKEGGQAGGGQQGLAHRVPLEIGTGTIPATITRRSGVGAALEKIYARHLVAGGLLVSQDAAHSYARSDERRVGKERVSACRSRWSPSHSKKKTQHKPKTNQ